VDKHRTDCSIEETIHVSRENISKQTSLLQVDNLIMNKSVAFLEASRRILNMQCLKISFLENVKNF